MNCVEDVKVIPALPEYCSFLSAQEDNTDILEQSLRVIKSYALEWKVNVSHENGYRISLEPRGCCKLSNDTASKASSLISSYRSQLQLQKEIRFWGLPAEITSKYEERGIIQMFDWQVKCLGIKNVLENYGNLVYSAPTSAGKTLVAEILAIKNVLERQKKVIIILPFVSVVREKTFYFQEMFGCSGVRVEGFMGSHGPPGGFESVHIAVCTIEKANSLVNKLMDESKMSELGAIIVDEMHMLGDPSRGYIIELLITKVKYLTKKYNDIKVQIIGMSATLPNLKLLSKWLNAELFVTEFRPIPLDELCLIDNKVFDNQLSFVRELEKVDEVHNTDSVLQICLETIKEGCSVLIFCTTKNWCENLAQLISSQFYKMGCSKSHSGMILRDQLNTEKILEVLGQLKNCPVGLDSLLNTTISFGVAYHHAGLTFDERDIIEGAFKSGAIRILIATSTLSSGVNLPARRVVIRSIVMQKQPINILTYKQMIGRAGRMGKDTKGESIIICSNAEKQIASDLMMGQLSPVTSCLEGGDKFMRAILEVIASNVAQSKDELQLYIECTLLHSEELSQNGESSLLTDTVDKLLEYELIRVQDCEDGNMIYNATPLGKACLSSSMAPNDGLSLFCELQKARQCIVLENDLHLIYLVTPYSVSSQWPNMDWMHLLNLWETLPKGMKRVGELVGVQESFMIQCVRGTMKTGCKQNKVQIHKRFYTALALQDLVNESPLSVVSSKFQCCRGMLQSLQQSAATFAGMVTAFCRQLGWKNMELLVSQFQDRLHFGIQSDLLDLMRLNSLNGMRARSLFNAGLESVCLLANADVCAVENALLLSIPFQSEKGIEGEDKTDINKRNTAKNIWITGKKGLTAREAAENLILEAQTYIQLEMGVKDINWAKKATVLSQHDETVQPEYNKNDTSLNETKSTCNGTSNKEHNDSDEKMSICEDKADSVTKSPQLESLGEEITQISLESNKMMSLVENITENEKADNVEPPLSEKIWETLELHHIREKSFNSLALNEIDFSVSFGSPAINKRSDEKSKLTQEPESPNLFEESILINSQLSHLINHNKCNYVNELENNSLGDTDSEENLRLHYSSNSSLNVEEEVKQHYASNPSFNFVDDIDVSFDPMTNSSSEEIASSQDYSVTVANKSPSIRKNGLNNIHTISKKSICFKSKSFEEKIKITIEGKNENTESKAVSIRIVAKNVDTLVKTLKNKDISCFLNLEDLSDRNLGIGLNILKKPSNSRNNLHFSLWPYKEKAVTAFAFCTNNKIFYLDCRQDTNLDSIRKIIQKILDGAKSVTIYDVKSTYLHLKSCEIALNSKYFDVAIGHWLIDKSADYANIAVLEENYLNYKIKDLIVDKQMSIKDKSCIRAWSFIEMRNKQMVMLQERLGVFQSSVLETEHKVLRILAENEYLGIRVDRKLAAQLLVDIKSCQDTLEMKAYQLAGHSFSMMSSRAVAKALGIFKGRKVSTKKSVLAAHNTQLSNVIMYWRKLEAIKTKTLYPLNSCLQFKVSGERIHLNYNTETQTGRITMHEPSIQNVPRTFSLPAHYLDLAQHEPSDEYVEFNSRNIFIASQGWTIVAADYCQLEMRILTHLCCDTKLIAIMKSDLDVFKAIAASWNCIDIEFVDEEQRQRAKQLCYGIIYGIGAKSLSEQLDVTPLEASVFMDTFQAAYPGIKRYKELVLKECRDNGFVETLKGRRRYLPHINHTRSTERDLGVVLQLRLSSKKLCKQQQQLICIQFM